MPLECCPPGAAPVSPRRRSRSHARPGNEPDRTPTSAIPVQRPRRKATGRRPREAGSDPAPARHASPGGGRRCQIPAAEQPHHRARPGRWFGSRGRFERSEQPVKTGAVHYKRSAEVHDPHNRQLRRQLVRAEGPVFTRFATADPIISAPCRPVLSHHRPNRPARPASLAADGNQ